MARPPDEDHVAARSIQRFHPTSARRASLPAVSSPPPETVVPASSRPIGTAAGVAFLVVLTVFYFGAGKLGLHFAYVHASATPVWPPTGIALAAVLLAGYRVWPAIFAGAFLVNLTNEGSVATSIGIAIGNTLEAIVGGYLVRRFANGARAFDRARDVFRFAIVASVVSTLLSPTFGVTSLVLGGYGRWADYGTVWWTWWLGDLAGDLVVAPALILWATKPPAGRNIGRRLEAVLLLLVTLLVGLTVFRDLFFSTANRPLAFVCMPPLFWAAFRFGPREVATGVAVLSGIAVWGTAGGLGPFLRAGPNESLILLEAFMATLAVTVIPVAALVWETRRAGKEREQSREEADRERAWLNAVLQQIPAGVAIAEAPYGRLVLGNERLERIWRQPFAPAASIEEYGVYRSFHADGRPYAPADWPLARSLLAGEVVMDEEIRIERGDGAQGTLSVSSAPIRGPRGTPVAAVAVFSDITERKQAETEREEFLRREQRLRNEAETANRAKDEFLAMLGHELRNPLAAVSNAAQVLQLSSPASGERARQASGILARQIEQLARIVDDLLDVARVTSRNVIVQARPTDLAEIVQGCVSSLRLAGGVERHHIAVEGNPAWVNGDPTRLEQVVTNLLTNAIKYTPPGGHVRVSTGTDGSRAFLRVADDGIGIPAELLPHVFDPFFQAEHGLDRRQGGLGIGLTLVRRLVELHDGTIEATSDGPGRGAVFCMRLPSIPAPVPAPAAQRPPAAAAASCRILLVEDNADARETLRLCLELAGCSVICAEDGPSGVEAASAERPDVALVDIGLPGLDGYDVARLIREAPGGKEIRLVALTGYGQAEDKRKAVEAGFDAHLVKPVAPERLLDLLSALEPRS
jgi:signal transduction histidine kinase